MLRMIIERTAKPDITVRLQPLILERAYYRREGLSFPAILNLFQI